MDHAIEVNDWSDPISTRSNVYKKYNVVFGNERLNKCRDNMIIYSLSINAQLMNEEPVGLHTVAYDSICDIEVIDNNIVESLSLKISNKFVESKKVNGKWDITKWFTLHRPLLNGSMPFSDPRLIIKFKNAESEEGIDKKITITWKALRYLWDLRVSLIKKEFMRHGDFCIIYIDGSARIVKLTFIDIFVKYISNQLLVS